MASDSSFLLRLGEAQSTNSEKLRRKGWEVSSRAYTRLAGGRQLAASRVLAVQACVVFFWNALLLIRITLHCTRPGPAGPLDLPGCFTVAPSGSNGAQQQVEQRYMLLTCLRSESAQQPNLARASSELAPGPCFSPVPVSLRREVCRVGLFCQW